MYQNPSTDHGGRSSDGSYAVSFHGPQQEMGCLDVFFSVHHRRGGFLGKIVQQGDDRLPAVPVTGDLLLEIIQPRSRIVLFSGLVPGKEDLSQQRSGKPLAGKITPLELVGRLQAGLVGRTAAEKSPVIANAEAPGELLIDAVAVFPVGRDLDALDVKTLLRQEALPNTALQTVWDEKIGGDPDGTGNHVCQRRRLPGPADPPELALDVDVLNGAVGRYDPQGCCVGRQLVVRVAEIRKNQGHFPD